MRHRRCRAASAEGARIEDRGAEGAKGVGLLGGGVPLPSLLGGLGERRELPQRGPGRSPGRQRILGIFQRLRSYKKCSSLVWHGAAHILLFTAKAYIHVYPVLL